MIKNIPINKVDDACDIYLLNSAGKISKIKTIAEFHSLPIHADTHCALEVSTKNHFYYLIIALGEAFNKIVDYVECENNQALVQARGNIYRINLNAISTLPNDCFNPIGFHNVGNDNGPATYLRSISNQTTKTMLVTDDKGAALINFNTILWQQKFEMAYAGNLKPLEITQSQIILEHDRLGEIEQVKIDIQFPRSPT